MNGGDEPSESESISEEVVPSVENSNVDQGIGPLIDHPKIEETGDKFLTTAPLSSTDDDGGISGDVANDNGTTPDDSVLAGIMNSESDQSQFTPAESFMPSIDTPTGESVPIPQLIRPLRTRQAKEKQKEEENTKSKKRPFKEFVIGNKTRSLIPVRVRPTKDSVSLGYLQLYTRNPNRDGEYKKGERIGDGVVDFTRTGKFYVDRNQWRLVSEIISADTATSQSASSDGRTKIRDVVLVPSKKDPSVMVEPQIRVYAISHSIITKDGRPVSSKVPLFHFRVDYSKVLILAAETPVELNGFKMSPYLNEVIEKVIRPKGERKKYSRDQRYETKLGSLMLQNAETLYKDGKIKFYVLHDIPLGIRPTDTVLVRAQIFGVKKDPNAYHLSRFAVSASSISTIHDVNVWNDAVRTAVEFIRFATVTTRADHIHTSEFPDPLSTIGAGFSIKKAIRNSRSKAIIRATANPEDIDGYKVALRALHSMGYRGVPQNLVKMFQTNKYKWSFDSFVYRMERYRQQKGLDPNWAKLYDGILTIYQEPYPDAVSIGFVYDWVFDPTSQIKYQGGDVERFASANLDSMGFKRKQTTNSSDALKQSATKPLPRLPSQQKTTPSPPTTTAGATTTSKKR